jgi:signal transduction histidine kinase
LRLFKNKEVRLSIAVTAALVIAFGVLLISTFSSFTQALNILQIKQNIAVIGTVAKSYPQLESEIVKNYTGDYKGDYDYGKKILEKYSYNEDFDINSNNLIQNDLRTAYNKIYILIAAFSLILIVFLIVCLNGIYKRIRKLSIGAEAVIEGQYNPIEGDRKEGDIGFLTYQFNTMTQRLGESVQVLNNEKLALKRIITDISHQLKTPLASLIMFNDLMTNDINMAEQERQTFLLESKNQLDRIEWLIKNMMKMAKLEAGVVDFEKSDGLISETIQRSIVPLQVIASEREIGIIISGDCSIKIKHDINWTTEAFSNIIKNCIEHSKNGSKITISWDENNVFVQIIIADYGSGIPKQELPKIFDRFYKGTNSCSPTNVGIGLYITKTIIEGQGGSIYAYSQEGQGAKFVIRLMKVS